MAGMPPEPFTEVEFEEATKMVRGNLAATAAGEDLLYLYARFKQAKEGPCQTPKPSFYQLTEKSKWSAWSELGSLGRAEAMAQYVDRVSLLRPGWREEVAREPTEGWVAVSSPVKVEEHAELTVWDLVKEGTLAQLTAVLDSLGGQVEAALGEGLQLTELTDPEGLTLLHWAADRGQVDMASLLLEREPGLLEVRDGSGQTALHFAASCGHGQLVTLLLHRGADRSAVDEDGLTPCNGDTEPDIKKLFD